MKWLYDKKRFLIFRDFKICLALIVLSAVLFSILAFLDVQGLLRDFDVAGMTAISDGRIDKPGYARYSEIMRDITSLGGTTLIILATSAAVLSFLLLGQNGKAAFMTLTVITSSILNNALKPFFDLPRPGIFAHETLVSSATFPSGHTLTGAVTYLTIAFLISRFEIKIPLKFLAFCIAILISFWVGISRLYLGVHWPSDVIGSWILALGWCALCWMIWLVCEKAFFQRGRTEKHPPKKG